MTAMSPPVSIDCGLIKDCNFTTYVANQGSSSWTACSGSHQTTNSQGVPPAGPVQNNLYVGNCGVEQTITLPMTVGATYVYTGYVSEPSELAPVANKGDAVHVYQSNGLSGDYGINSGRWTPFSIILRGMPGQVVTVGFSDRCSYYCAFEVMSPTVSLLSITPSQSCGLITDCNFISYAPDSGSSAWTGCPGSHQTVNQQGVAPAAAEQHNLYVGNCGVEQTLINTLGARLLYSGYVSEPSELASVANTGNAVAVYQTNGPSSTYTINSRQWTPFSLVLNATPGQRLTVGFRDICT